MKSIKIFFVLICLVISIESCKKSNNGRGGLASVNIVQAMMNVPSMVVNFSDTAIPYYKNQISISYGSFYEYGLPSGRSSFTIVSSNDTIKPLIGGTLNLKAGSIYSFYLAGDDSRTDTLMLQDTIPVHTDSSAGVRFINLSPGSLPISINLEGNSSSLTEFANLGYKQISSFKSYPITPDISSYTFEVRDQASGTLLTTFTWSFSIYKNHTLVINGSEDPSAAIPIGVFSVNNF